MWKMFFRNLYILVFIINFNIQQYCSENINIGLISENIYPATKIIFNKAIEDANQKNEDLSFTGIIEEITFGNPLDVSKQLCKILESSVAAVFGPSSPSSADQAVSVCDAKEIPFIDTRWDFETELPTLNLHPHPSQLAIILKDLIVAFEWQGFTILYESGDFLALANEILELYGPIGPTITVRKFDLDLNGNYRNVLRRVKKSNDKAIIVLSSTASLPEFFKQALQVGLLTDTYQYIIGDLDFQTINMEPYQHGEANITSIRLLSPENNKVEELITLLNAENLPEAIENVTCPISVTMGLIYDGVQLLAEVFKHITPTPIELNCADCNTWNKGYTLVNYMKSIIVNGISGEISFDHQGLRTSFEAEIIELTTAGIIKIGNWKTSDGISIDRKGSKKNIEESKSLANKNFVVLIALSNPYIMFKETIQSLSGNNQYEGFGIELIDELANKLGFKYSFKLQEDGAYGSKNSTTGEWNGMVLELLKENGDLAITDLTMTSQRESAVDFTIPFMNLGIAILFRKPKKDAPELFSFMSPFSEEVWKYLGVAYLSVACSLFILGRLAPAEWDNPYPCIEEPTELENQFSFANSLWFTVGALLQQGSEIAPKASSTRTVASTWWFFTLILVSSYTANLAAFLTIESLSTPLKSAEDLAAGKGDVAYGAKMLGSTYKFFEESKYPTYQKMFEYMKTHPESQPKTNEEGVSLVENTNYAFLMESTSIEYTIERKCTLTQVGNLLDEKGYGIAMRKNWPYRDILSKGILELQEQGVLTKMKTKWWKEKRGGGACSDTGGDGGGAVPLGIENLGGVFVVLIIGSCSAVLISVFEMIVSVQQRASELKISFKDELLEELKFIIKCRGNTKVVRKPMITPNTSRNSSISFNSMELSNNDDFNFNSEDDVKLSKPFYTKS